MSDAGQLVSADPAVKAAATGIIRGKGLSNNLDALVIPQINGHR
jgi:hypothetical protein